MGWRCWLGARRLGERAVRRALSLRCGWARPRSVDVSLSSYPRHQREKRPRHAGQRRQAAPTGAARRSELWWLTR
ncbi:MAG: hypothetical protein ACRDRF_20310, partial [Pseudonocardiaceae bacterium]